jgi:hypothetical protein
MPGSFCQDLARVAIRPGNPAEPSVQKQRLINAAPFGAVFADHVPQPGKATTTMYLKAWLLIAALCTTPSALAAAPAYTPDGKMVRPADYREWIYLSSGLDMSYSQIAMKMDHSMFNNVFVNPDAYRAFLQSGHWPDGTMLVLELRMAGTATPPLRHGQYQTPGVMGLEVHVHDASRFKNGWAFFSFDDTGPGTKVADGSNCEICHKAHAAVDTTFVQFYPTLLPVAEQNHTLSPEFLQDRLTIQNNR